MNPGQSGLGDKLLGGQAELNPFGGQTSTIARWKVLAVVGAVLAIGTIVLQSLRADPTPEPVGIGGKPASKPATLNPRAEKEAWIGEAAGRVRKTEERQQMLDQQMKEFREEMRRKDEQIEKLLKAQGPAPPAKLASLAPSAQGAGRASILPPPHSALPPPPQGGQAIVASSARPVPGPPTPSGPTASRPTQGLPPTQPAAPINRIRVFSPDPQPAQGPGAPTKYWIPTGTMIPVKLLILDV